MKASFPSVAVFSAAHSTRRRFLKSAAVALTAAAVSRHSFAAAASRSGGPWEICCLNRPWVKWSLDEMLDGVKAAGFRTLGLQTVSKANPFIGSDATREHLDALKQKIPARGLKATMGRLSTQEAKPFADATAEIRLQIDRAQELGLRVLINTGTGKPEHYAAWYRVMAFAAAYGADRGVQIVTKPHGGVNAAASELLKCLEKVNHANFGVWYDPGNVLFYTGKDSLVELEPVVKHVSAFVGKDCVAQNGDAMIQFGQGKVDFAGILRRLKRADFKGPIWIETCAIGETPAATTANAKANREFLERALATI